MNKQAVIHITDAFPVDDLCARLGVTPHSVRYARTVGVFPASWYAVLSDMCTTAGILCPRSAFNWKAPAQATGDAA